MAGKKKENAATPHKWEDVPEIPKEEQPYPLPVGWKWVKLGELTQIIGGGTPSTAKNEYFENGDIPWITPADLSEFTDIYISHGKRNITKAGLENSSARLIPKDSVCLTTRAPIGYVCIADNDLCTNQGFKSFLPTKSYFSSYLYWYLKGNKEFLDTFASGTTFLEISGTRAKEIPLPLPPLETQHRIVSNIESLFSKLDEAAEKVQTVIDSHEARKQAILHKAFSGELTRKWREENGVSLDSWEEKNLKDIGEITTGSTPSTKNKNYYGGNMPFIKPTDLNNGRYVSQSAEYLSESGRNISRIVRSGSTCVCCIGATLSKCGFLTCDAVTNQQINTISPYKFMNDLYVYYYCLSDKFKNNLIENSSATTLPIINKSKMGILMIKVPSLAEQKEIIKIIDPIFLYFQDIYKFCYKLVNKINRMKKNILTKTFQGRL